MKKCVALLLALVLCLSLAACGPKNETVESPSAAPSAPPSDTPTPTPEPSQDPAVEVDLAVLSGPTGVGAAKLIADGEAGQTANRYHVTVCADNQQVTAGLINGEFDIAAVATNVASNLYHKTDGGVQIAAVNTLGVLYLLAKEGAGVASVADLKGKTLYATGEGANPEYALNYLLTQNGVAPGEVDIVWGAADEVNAAMLAGDGQVCMLPVPAATALEAKSEGAVKAVVSLSDEWDALGNGSQLTMGCVVVRTRFAQEHPEAVAAFLEEYGASIAYVRDNPADVAQTVADLGIAPSAGIAQKSIPQCNLVFVTGTEMRDTIQGYYEVLYAANPASIGGSIPDDGFYFLGR